MFYEKEQSVLSYSLVHPDFGTNFIREIFNNISAPKMGGTILDVGTGNGQLIAAIQEEFSNKHSLIALDLSAEMLSYAAKKVALHSYTI